MAFEAPELKDSTPPPAEIQMAEEQEIPPEAAAVPEKSLAQMEAELDQARLAAAEAEKPLLAYGRPKEMTRDDANYGVYKSTDPEYNKLDDAVRLASKRVNELFEARRMRLMEDAALKEADRINAVGPDDNGGGERNARVMGFTPEERKELQELLAASKADEALMAKISKGGELDPTNPAEVAAAMRIIKKEMKQDARLSVDELAKMRTKNAENPVAAAAVEKVIGDDQNIRNEVAREQVRARVAEAARLDQLNADGNAITTDLPYKEVIAASQAQERFEANPDAAIVAGAKVLVKLSDTYDKRPELYEAIGRDPHDPTRVVMQRVDRTGPDGKELPDPKDWKVVKRSVKPADLLSRGGRLAA